MPSKVLNLNSSLAVFLLIVMAFLLCVVPVSGKTALGGSEFSLGHELEKSLSNPLTLLEKKLSCRSRVSGICDGPENNSESVYRGDTRSPDEIFEEGFEPRSPGSDTSLEDYVDLNEPSNFVGTTKSPDVADDFAADQGGGYRYDIDRPEDGIDVNEVYPDGPFPHEQEIAIPGGVPCNKIRGCTPINSNAEPSGDYIQNPNYQSSD